MSEPDPHRRLQGPEPSAAELDAGARRLAGGIALAFAAGMHLIVGGFVVLSPRLAPAWAVAILVAVWLVLGYTLWRWHRARPLVTLLVPFLAAGLVWGALAAGQRTLGWGG